MATVSWQTGFLIEDVLLPGLEINVEINVPPLLNETGQLTENERIYTRQIASLHTHVEQAIKQMKNYQILHKVPNNMYNSVNQLLYVCTMFTNFLLPCFIKL